MSYNYSTWVAALTTMAATTSADTDFTSIIPSIIDNAEHRIYRDLNLLTQVTRDTSSQFTPNSRTFILPQHFVDIDGVTPFISGVRGTPLIPTTRAFIDYSWPTEVVPTTPSIPIYMAMITDQIIIVGPAPDTSYGVEVVGKVRPIPLSPTNTTTFLTLYLPDLWMAASMVFVSGYQKNFSAAGDDPAQSVNWEQHYNKLMVSAATEETAKRFFGMQWTTMQMTPSPPMTPAAMPKAA
jgi:hypothetical protein